MVGEDNWVLDACVCNAMFGSDRTCFSPFELEPEVYPEFSRILLAVLGRWFERRFDNGGGPGGCGFAQ